MSDYAKIIPRIAMKHAKMFPGSCVVVVSENKRSLDAKVRPAFDECSKSFQRTNFSIQLDRVDGLCPSEIIFMTASDPSMMEGFMPCITLIDDKGRERRCPTMIIADHKLGAELAQAVRRVMPHRLVLINWEQ